MRLCISSLAVLLWLALPATAPASSVHIEREPGGFCSVCDRPSADSESLRLVAGAGERNALEVRRRDGALIVTDRTSPLAAGEGCVQEDEHRARCPAGRLFAATVDAGDGDDEVRLDIEAFVTLGPGDDVLRATGARVDADGGEGDDRLHGSPNWDVLIGGPGADLVAGGRGDDTLIDGEGRGPGDYLDFTGEELNSLVRAARASGDAYDGGRGQDYVTYADRHAAVRADLARGRASEDRLRGVEHIQGGYGDDILVGDDRQNFLFGNTGRDRLVGRGGHDGLSDGSDMDGGPGRDVFDPVDRGATVRCGTGRDEVTTIRRGTTLSGCERLTLLDDDTELRLRPAPAGRGAPALSFIHPFCRVSRPCRVRVTVTARDGTTIARRAMIPRSGRPRHAVPLTGVGRRLLARPGRVRAVLKVTETSHRGIDPPRTRSQSVRVVL